MSIKMFIAAASVCLLSASGALADLVVTSSAGPGTINTLGGPVPVTFTISLQTTSGTQAVDFGNLTFAVRPIDPGVNLTGTISQAAGAPAFGQFSPDADSVFF